MGPLAHILFPMPLTSSEWAKRLGGEPAKHTVNERNVKGAKRLGCYPLAATFNTYLAVFSRCL